MPNWHESFSGRKLSPVWFLLGPNPLMMLPRRVPWKSLEELDEVCSWIYSPEADDKSKQAAVHRVGIVQMPARPS